MEKTLCREDLIKMNDEMIYMTELEKLVTKDKMSKRVLFFFPFFQTSIIPALNSIFNIKEIISRVQLRIVQNNVFENDTRFLSHLQLADGKTV